MLKTTDFSETTGADPGYMYMVIDEAWGVIRGKGDTTNYAYYDEGVSFEQLGIKQQDFDAVRTTRADQYTPRKVFMATDQMWQKGPLMVHVGDFLKWALAHPEHLPEGTRLIDPDALVDEINTLEARRNSGGIGLDELNELRGRINVLEGKLRRYAGLGIQPSVPRPKEGPGYASCPAKGYRDAEGKHLRSFQDWDDHFRKIEDKKKARFEQLLTRKDDLTKTVTRHSDGTRT